MKTLKSLVETFKQTPKHDQGVRKADQAIPLKKYKDNTPMSLKGNLPADSQGTQEFVDDHEIEILPDVNGNKDDVFKASNIKHSIKDEPKHGYTAKASADVNEMSAAETAKREDMVKGMKKNFSDFKKRYGADAKTVMYATATKQAMKEDQEETFDSILEAVHAHQASTEESELVEAYAAILEVIHESLETEEEKQYFEEMLDSDDAFDELVELVENIITEDEEE